MAKSADAFRTISEVAEWLDTPAHVLRFWESKFAQVKPVKRAGGRRYYRPQDMRLLGGIKKLLHDEGMTIKGVQRLLREKGVKHVAALSQHLAGEDAADAVDMAPAAEPAQVVDFHRETQPFGGTGDDRTDAAPEPEPAERPAAPEAAAAGWQPPGESPPPEPVPENDAPSVDDKPAPAPDEPEAAPDPGTQEPPAPAEPAPAARIPAFLNRPDAPTKGDESADLAQEPEPTPEAQPEPEPESTTAETPRQGPPPKPESRPAPTPLAADVPDTDPGDSDFAEPGLLTRLASVPRPCDAATAKALQPLLPRVQGLLAASGTG